MEYFFTVNGVRSKVQCIQFQIVTRCPFKVFSVLYIGIMMVLESGSLPLVSINPPQ